MSSKNYTLDDFKEMKKSLKLNNKDISEIIGTSEANVKIQTSPGKKVPTWARSMIFVFKQQKITQ